MNWNDKQERARFLEAFGGLGEIFGKEFSDFAAKAYFQALAGNDIETVVKAMGHAAIKLRFFPKPVELMEFIGGTKDDKRILAEQQALLVLRTMGSHGAYASVQFADPVMAAVVRALGGWVGLCRRTKEAEQKWFVRDFVERYLEYSERNIGSTEPLPGLHGGEPKKIELDPEYVKAFELGAPFHELVAIGQEDSAA